MYILIILYFESIKLLSQELYTFQHWAHYYIDNTVSPNKHGNSMTIIASWHATSQYIFLQSSWAEVDKLNNITEYPFLLGLTIFCRD